jgi:hypothetical protein
VETVTAFSQQAKVNENGKITPMLPKHEEQDLEAQKVPFSDVGPLIYTRAYIPRKTLKY